MRLIVDSNRIISALIKEGVSRKILSSKNLEFFTVGYIKEEIGKYKAVIIEKSAMSAKAIDTLFSLVMENMNVVPEEDVKLKMEEALNIMKGIDTKDAPFIAAALAMPNDGIWSHDRHFEMQNKIKVWLAKDLIKYI